MACTRICRTNIERKTFIWEKCCVFNPLQKKTLCCSKYNLNNLLFHTGEQKKNSQPRNERKTTKRACCTEMEIMDDCYNRICHYYSIWTIKKIIKTFVLLLIGNLNCWPHAIHSFSLYMCSIFVQIHASSDLGMFCACEVCVLFVWCNACFNTT